MKKYKQWTILALLTFLSLMALLVLTDLGFTLSLPLDKAVLDREFEEKVQALLLSEDGNAVDVILCGDSRAERQLIPDVVKTSTGLNAVNVATNGLDLVTMANGFRKYSILERKNAILVISASIFQVNDGAVGEGYTTPACIFNLKWTDQIRLFKKHLPYLINKKIEYYFDYFKSTAASRDGRQKEIAEKGYVGIDRAMALSNGQLNMDMKKVAHPWYKDFTFPGKKWEVFQKALRDIASSGHKIFVFNPPACPAWLEMSEDTPFDAAERQFSSLLRQEVQKYKNTFFLDFYSEYRESFTNDMFYDLQHLNRVGSAHFTEIVLKHISRVLNAEGSDMGPAEDFVAGRD